MLLVLRMPRVRCIIIIFLYCIVQDGYYYHFCCHPVQHRDKIIRITVAVDGGATWNDMEFLAGSSIGISHFLNFLVMSDDSSKK